MSTAPRVPRIPVRGPARIEPEHDAPRWYESTALRLGLLSSIGLAGALVVYVWRQVLGWLA
jgi:hypothetical protein